MKPHRISGAVFAVWGSEMVVTDAFLIFLVGADLVSARRKQL